MSKANWIRLIGYLLALAAALFYPVSKIISMEYPKTPPETYLFRTVVYDPYDPMRGRYVRLNLNTMQIRIPREYSITKPRNPCYAVLEKNADGIAVITDLVADLKSVPKGKHAVKAKYLYYAKDWDQKTKRLKKNGRHSIQLPFDRFYMNEKLAPEAERIVRENLPVENSVLLKVRIYTDGSFAVEDLLVKGKGIREMIREQGTAKGKYAGEK